MKPQRRRPTDKAMARLFLRPSVPTCRHEPWMMARSVTASITNPLRTGSRIRTCAARVIISAGATDTGGWRRHSPASTNRESSPFLWEGRHGRAACRRAGAWAFGGILVLTGESLYSLDREGRRRKKVLRAPPAPAGFNRLVDDNPRAFCALALSPAGLRNGVIS